jgi:hypothetical protein
MIRGSDLERMAALLFSLSKIGVLIHKKVFHNGGYWKKTILSPIYPIYLEIFNTKLIKLL